MPDLPAAQLAALAALSTPEICNAIETFRIRMRNEGYLGGAIASRVSLPRAMIGYALTLRMRTGTPPASGFSYIDRTDWWAQLEAAPRPKVIVIQDMDDSPGVGAVAGQVHCAIFRAFGAVGVVTNGALRDLDGLRHLEMHGFSRWVSPSHAYAHIVDVGMPVDIGGLRIASGDILHGDAHGIAKVPPDLVTKIPAVVARMNAQERAILAMCADPHTTMDKLRDALAHFANQEGF